MVPGSPVNRCPDNHWRIFDCGHAASFPVAAFLMFPAPGIRSWLLKSYGIIVTSTSVKDWCMSPHGIVGPSDQSSQNSGIKCPLARLLTLPNLMLPNDVREKHYRFIFFIPFSIFAPLRDPLGHSSPILALMYSKALSINLPNFVSFWNPSMRYICCQMLSTSSTAWPAITVNVMSLHIMRR